MLFGFSISNSMNKIKFIAKLASDNDSENITKAFFNFKLWHHLFKIEFNRNHRYRKIY